MYPLFRENHKRHGVVSGLLTSSWLYHAHRISTGKISARFKQMHTHPIVVRSYSRQMNETLRLWQCETHLKVLLCHHTYGTCSFLHIIWYQNIISISFYMMSKYIYIYDHKKSSDLSCHLHPSRHVAAPFQRWHQESWGFILPLPRPPGFRPFAERRVKPQPVTWEAAKSINWKRVFWARPWKLMVQVQMKFPGLGCKTYFQDLLGRVIEKSRNSKKHFFGERRKCYCSYQEGYI